MKVELVSNELYCARCAALAGGGLGFLVTVAKDVVIDIDQLTVTIDKAEANVRFSASIPVQCERCGTDTPVTKVIARIPYEFQPVEYCDRCGSRALEHVSSTIDYDETARTIEASIQLKCTECNDRNETRSKRFVHAMADQLDRIKKLAIGPKGIEVERSDAS